MQEQLVVTRMHCRCAEQTTQVKIKDQLVFAPINCIAVCD